MLVNNIVEIEKILANKNIIINTDIDSLHEVCDDVVDMKLGERIANKLFAIMTDNKDCISLSANQIGIKLKICCVNVTHPFYFINPKIVSGDGIQVRLENCYSLPHTLERTVRYTRMTVECDNYEDLLYWDVSHLKPEEFASDIHALEMATIQHEIHHLYGKTILDDVYIPHTIINGKKYGRNERINITNGDEHKTIKYKDFKVFELNGYRII